MSDTLQRKELRAQTAQLVNGLKRAELLKFFGISRVANITGLDSIGLPVYSSVRALSSSLSMHSGKGLELQAARAGAILEAIEYEVALHPTGKFRLNRAYEIPCEERLELGDCFPVRSSVVNHFTPLTWETMTNVQNGEEKLVPSDLIWMTNRIVDQPLIYLQSSSNGLAAGGTVEDAILSGLYEVLERDAWTLSQYLSDNYGIFPPRIPLIALSDQLETAVRKIEKAEARLHLFDITTNYQIPAFSAMLLDLSGGVAGTFAGYGCHLDAETAAVRAITEACQSRCCYINGARDDLYRRQFILMKRLDQQKLDQMFNELPIGPSLAEYRKFQPTDVKTELRYLLKFIKQFGVAEVYAKELRSLLDGAIRVVRVFSPQCEPCRLDHWAPGLRCLSYCNQRMGEAAGKYKPQPDIEEGEEWKQA